MTLQRRSLWFFAAWAISRGIAFLFSEQAEILVVPTSLTGFESLAQNAAHNFININPIYLNSHNPLTK